MQIKDKKMSYEELLELWNKESDIDEIRETSEYLQSLFSDDSDGVRIDFFSRQQAIKLSGLSSGQLSRLDRAYVVQPQKLGSNAHPVCLYTLIQVLELRTIAALRQNLSMQEVKKVIECLRKCKFEPAFFSKFLLFCNNDLYWFDLSEISEAIVDLTRKNNGQIVLKIVHPIGDSVTDLLKFLKES